MSERETKMIKVHLPAPRLGKAASSKDSMSHQTKTGPGVVAQEMSMEMLAILFEMLDRQGCAAAAVVCRRWSGVALDKLWRSLPSLLPLFGLLGPLEDSDLGYDLHPDVVLTEKCWDLFKSYGARVRHFVYDDDDHPGQISSGLIMRALAVHPEGGILPNLRAVHWNVEERGLNHVLAFCSFSLERMHLDIASYEIPVEQVKRLLSCLSSSLADRLKFFRFETVYLCPENVALSIALNTFIKTQRGLLGLELPRYVEPDLATVTAVCRQLQTFQGELIPEVFQVAMNALATRGSSLRCVRLVRAEADFEEETMCMADIEPLLQLSVVEDLALWLGCDLKLDVQDIQRMGQAWGKLVSLIIYPDGGDGFPLSQLVTFAESFPALEHFAASVDCTGEITSANDIPARFKSLRRLLLFGLRIQGEKSPLIAEFLAIVCGPGVDVMISHGPQWDEILAGDFVWERAWDSSSTDLKEIQDWMATFYRVQEGIQRLQYVERGSHP